jgi:hypothetical protein
MAQDWDIKPRGNCCGACNAEFQDGDVCFSALVFDEQGYNRRDYCGGCWSARQAAESAFSTWQGVFAAPPPPPQREPGKESAESLLRRLMEGHDASHGAVIYILAVMLERRRVFVERDVRQDAAGARTLVYEHRGTGETFLVPDPQLRLDDLEHVQQQVLAMLGGPQPPPEASGAPPPPAPPPAPAP